MRTGLATALLLTCGATGCLGGCLDLELWSDPCPSGECGACRSDDDCPEERERCDAASGACFLRCELDRDCPAGALCCVASFEPTERRACVEEEACTLPTCGPGQALAIDRRCHASCAGDADCGEGDERCCDVLPAPLCLDDPTCARSVPCAEGLDHDAVGTCRPVCAAIADCYPFGAFCATDGRCYGTLAGDEFNACAAARAAPAMDPSGPILYGPFALDLDPATEASCLANGRCGTTELACGAQVYVWDPDGDLPTSPAVLFEAVELRLADGTGITPYAIEPLDPATGVLAFSLCVGPQERLESVAVQLRDRAGHASNALCLAQVGP